MVEGKGRLAEVHRWNHPFAFASILARQAGASVGVRDLSLTVAGLALEGIDFMTWLLRLPHDWVARPIAG